MKKLILLLIKFYRLCLSPYLPKSCRFYPSCSQYAQICFQENGLFCASLYTLKRLCSCHPFHSGGVDFPPKLSH